MTPVLKENGFVLKLMLLWTYGHACNDLMATAGYVTYEHILIHRVTFPHCSPFSEQCTTYAPYEHNKKHHANISTVLDSYERQILSLWLRLLL